jgi:RND family efflux transporter MFP subunit
MVLAAGLALLTPACSQKKTGGKIAQTVKTDTVRAYGEKSRAAFPGKVKAASEANLSFRISGTIEKLHVEAGNRVKKGQVVAEMDSRDYAIQLKATEAEYKQIKSEAERVIALYEKNGATPNDYDKAVYGLKQITAKYEAHRNALADTKLLAPFDGYVQKCLFDAGETVSAGMPIVSVISANAPEVEINIPSSEFIRRDKFDSFACTVDIYPGRTFPLELIGVTQKANLNQLYTMRLRIKNTATPLPSPGMTAMVTVYFKPENTAVVNLPLSAVFEADGASMVWIYSSGTQTVERRAVKIATVLPNGTALVAEGLQAGEIVVTAGVHSLQEGEKVKLLPAASPTNVGGLL